ncbi:MAG TPA: DMT family transporter [Verrucomicrobiales bacterium]|nr:DMT family transporter [Verrucomicrobiales bacterium]
MPRWLLWTFVALFSWGGWAVLSKVLGPALSPGQSQAFSTIGFLPIVLPLAISGRSVLRQASRKGLLLALTGGAVSCLGNIPYYAAVGRGEKFATVVSLAAMAPVVTVLLAIVFLRERLNWLQCAGLILAVTAIWLFNVSNGAGLLSPAVLVALPPIVLWGLSGFLQKAATNHVSAEASALVYLGAFLPMGVYYGLSEPWPASVTVQTWIVVIALGFFLAFGNFAVLAAFARGGKAAVISPLVNLFPVVGIGLAFLLLDETVEKREAAGIACALAAVAALSLERRSPQ